YIDTLSLHDALPIYRHCAETISLPDDHCPDGHRQSRTCDEEITEGPNPGFFLGVGPDHESRCVYERKNRNSMAVGQTQMLRDGSCRIDVNRPAEVVVIVSDDCQGSSVDSNEAGDRARCEVPTDLNERAFIGDRVYGVADGE